MVFRWRGINGPTLSAGLALLSFFRGFCQVLQRNPIFCDFSVCVCGGGGEGIWTTCLPIWITTCIVNQCAKYVSSVKLETNVGQKLLTWYIRLIVIMLYCTTVAFLLSNDNVTVLKACGKHALTDANYYCKMTSVMVIETRHLSMSS